MGKPVPAFFMAIKLNTLPAISLASGVATPLFGATLACTSMVIQADSTNVGEIYIGGPEVTNLNGVAVSPGDTCEITADISGRFSDEFFAQEVYAFSATSGNSAKILVFSRRL